MKSNVTNKIKLTEKPLGSLKVTMAACSSGITTILSGRTEIFSKYSSKMSAKASEIENF